MEARYHGRRVVVTEGEGRESASEVEEEKPLTKRTWRESGKEGWSVKTEEEYEEERRA